MEVSMQQRFIRFPELQKMVGLGRTQIYKKIKAGTFPSQVKLDTASGWVESEIQEWMQQRIKQGRQLAL
jgi:prophage regulatory protein